jgi:hypothetical protein
MPTKKKRPDAFKLVPNAALRGALKDLGLSLLANAELSLEGKVAKLYLRFPRGRRCFHRKLFDEVRTKASR